MEDKEQNMPLDMNEIEKRLQMASAYRKLLESKFLEPSEVNELIEAELKEFIHGKLEVILGVRPAENQTVYFSGMEVVALKALARKVMEPKEQKEEVPKVKTEPSVEIAPQPKTQKTYKPRAKPAKKPTSVSTDKAAVQPKIKAVVTETAKEELPSNIVKENGKTYEMIEVGGKTFAKDITKQVRSSNAVPTPSKEQYESMMYAQAMQDLSVSSRNPLFAAAAAASSKGE